MYKISKSNHIVWKPWPCHSVIVYSSAMSAATAESGRRCQISPRTLDSYYGSAIWIPGKCRPLAPPMLAWKFLIKALAKHFFGLKCLEYIFLTVHKEKNPAKIEYLWHKLQYMLSCLLPFPHSRAFLVSADLCCRLGRTVYYNTVFGWTLIDSLILKNAKSLHRS